MSFTFLHAADLHLDSPFAGLTARSGEVAASLRTATFEAFENLLRLAQEEKVLFVVFAGDIYDGADRSLRAQLAFRNGLQRLAEEGISSFVVHGNHDSLEGWSAALTWPRQVHIFGSEKIETIPVEQNGRTTAAVSGISYCQRHETRNLAELFKAGPDGMFRVALLHCNCGGYKEHENYAPCRLNDLVEKKFDYWALGHVHQHSLLSRSPWVVYPGNIQGRNIRETGPGGCCLVHVDDSGRAEVEFRELDVVRWATAEVDIAGLKSLNDLEKEIHETLERLGREASPRPLICRLTLTGRGPMYAELRRKNALEDLGEAVRDFFADRHPFLWLESLAGRCRPEIDPAERIRENDLTAEALAAADRLLREEDPALLLEQPLKDLLGHRGARKALPDFPDAEQLRQLIDDARWLCLDLLEDAE